ncbi:MAG TPA: hypothetical protein VH300_10310 [Thermoleophilaceae bacterium]|jgi:hypothetical protein|nr:hypothetical protein [Thermoleophilaceae bacterium]
MNAYKFLKPDGTGVFSAFPWPLPAAAPGAWVSSDPDPCRSGIHACRPQHLPLWIGRSLYEIELDGEIRDDPTKVIASQGRLVRRIEAWDERAHDDYTRMCADRAHELTRAHGLDSWDAVIEPSIPEGGALLGFVAARIADEVDGEAGYYRERASQTDWLVRRLQLSS